MKNLHPIFEDILKDLYPKEETLDEIIDNCIKSVEVCQGNIKGFYNEIQNILGSDNKIN